MIRTGGEIVNGLTRENRERIAANRLRAQQLAARRQQQGSFRSAAAAMPAASGSIPTKMDCVGTAARFFNEHCQRALPVRRTANGLVIEATTLYAENVDVNRENRDKLARLVRPFWVRFLGPLGILAPAFCPHLTDYVVWNIGAAGCANRVYRTRYRRR